jgi:hypothetical protein
MTKDYGLSLDDGPEEEEEEEGDDLALYIVMGADRLTDPVGD